MLNRFNNYIFNNLLFDKKEKILLAVSGGIDSVVMMELFSASGFDFAIAHCNFKLRGEESDKDELFVRGLAKEKNAKYFVKRFDTREFAKKNNLSIQMAARQLRYDWFESIIEKEGYSLYSSAHHLDDQIETFFINLFRGTGISGLHGIKPKQGKLIRPLLFANRRDIETYAEINKIIYREDSSNKKTNYLRNNIRHNLIPVLEKIKPGFADMMDQNIKRFSQSEQIYRNEIETKKRKIVQHINNEVKIAITQLEKLKPLETYLYEFLIPYGFSFAITNDISNSLKSGSGKKFFSDSHILIRDRDFLLIRKKEGNKFNNCKEHKIHLADNYISRPIELKLEKLGFSDDFSFSEDKKVASFDFDKLVFPLILRKWKKGDHFFPLGMNNKKLLSNFFIDNKFSLFEKEDTWLLTSNDKVVWIVGHRIDNRFKVDKPTKNIFQIMFKPPGF
ncbi:MAG: tRNA lysidine(34) synthetase TilS [Bacteroidetes bacterium]|nr:MAG: tRNA lysidine(34) synthetase TilS [Bacteroidota bacterium]